MKTKHPFAESQQCTRVPVALVPVTDEHPAGLKWDRPCLCPDWQELEHQVGTPDGSTRIVRVSGCLKKLLPWMLAGAARQAQAGLNEIVAARQDIQRAEVTTAAGLYQIAAAVARNQEVQLLQPSTDEQIEVIKRLT